jgi:hypothetical protein
MPPRKPETEAEKRTREKDDELDRELEDSFPASDPPKLTRRSRKPREPKPRPPV